MHRLISVLYPIRLYCCTTECGWRGLLPSLTTLARRRQQLRLVLAVLAIGAVVGLLAWRYAGELLWSPAQSPLNEGFEETSGTQ
jgi:hypothetical protein